MKLSGKEIKQQIIQYYYSNVYEIFNKKSALFLGISYFYNVLQKSWGGEYSRILELGSGNGEFLPYLKVLPKLEYIALDLRPLDDDKYLKNMPLEFRQKFSHVTGSAQNIPFSDKYFDLCFSTCILHHVEEPIEVLMESRRVIKIGGEIIFALPTDPGLLNQFIKHLYTFRRMRKISKYDPALFYALDHPNHIVSLITLIKFVFQEDELTFRFSPFRFPSWNMNLVVCAHIRKSNTNPKYIL
jgi:ubiquinone/menaquinone biosynthesis C-methylase UbiE